MQNTGLLESQELNAKDYRFGGMTAMQGPELLASGDWTPYLPTKELQKRDGLETMACVTFSALNCLETLSNFLTLNWNKSDRFTAKMSGTSMRGNYFHAVAESIRLHGIVDEELWPFEGATWEAFYAEIPERICDVAKGILEDWDIRWQWVETDNLREALKYGPIQIGVNAWPKPRPNGLYDDGGTVKRNHAVMLYNATDEYYEIYDNYPRDKKQLVPTYQIHAGIQYFLTPKRPMPISLPNNTLVQLVEGKGGFAFHLEGKLYIDDLSEILATHQVRASVQIGENEDGPVYGFKTKPVALTQAQWDAFPKFNLKNKPL